MKGEIDMYKYAKHEIQNVIKNIYTNPDLKLKSSSPVNTGDSLIGYSSYEFNPKSGMYICLEEKEITTDILDVPIYFANNMELYCYKYKNINNVIYKETYYSRSEMLVEKEKGKFIEIINSEDKIYPMDGIQDGFWWILLTNSIPVISGYNKYLNERYENFDIEFEVDDADKDDILNLKIIMDGNILNTIPNTIRQYSYKYNINIDNLELGRHEIVIQLTDGCETVERLLVFDKINKPQIDSDIFISGRDEFLGYLNEDFTISFKANSEEHQSFEYQIYIDSELKTHKTDLKNNQLVNYFVQLDSLSVGEHIIRIDIFNGLNIATRYYNFNKLENTTSKIIVSKLEKEMGIINKLIIPLTASTDNENVDLKTNIYIDGDLTLSFPITCGYEYNINVPLSFVEKNKMHDLIVDVIDSNNKRKRQISTFFYDSNVEISGMDKALGIIEESICIQYFVSHNSDNIICKELLDDKEFNSYIPQSNINNSLIITNEQLKSLNEGTHTILIKITSNNRIYERKFTFEKKNSIILYSKIKETQKLDKSICFAINCGNMSQNTIIKVFATNIAKDQYPVWEDISEYIGKTYYFKNAYKGNNEFGTRVKIVIKKE